MRVSGIRGVLLDLSGTLYSGEHRIEGTRRTLRWLEEAGIGYRFLTNTTTKSRKEIAGKLAGLGLECPEETILTPLAAARERLAADGCSSVFPLLREEVLGDLGGIAVEEEAPDAVLVGDLGADFDYGILNRAFRALMDGAAFYSLARNRFFEKEGELFLDVGAFAEALAFATRREDLCLGKPSGAFFDRALSALGLPAEAVAVVGDDLEADVLGAMEHRMTGILVRTGKFNADLLDRSGRKPDAVIDSIATLPECLGKAP